MIIANACEFIHAYKFLLERQHQSQYDNNSDNYRQLQNRNTNTLSLSSQNKWIKLRTNTQTQCRLSAHELESLISTCGLCVGFSCLGALIVLTCCPFSSCPWAELTPSCCVDSNLCFCLLPLFSLLVNSTCNNYNNLMDSRICDSLSFSQIFPPSLVGALVSKQTKTN